MLAEYDFVVSLGDCCAPAANIRRRFGVTTASPFDWWVSPFNATMKLLREGFANVLLPDNLEIIPAAEGYQESVRCNYHGMLHHHDFERSADQLIIKNIAVQQATVLQKTRFIVDRFRATLANKSVLFIRNGLDGDLSDLWYLDPGKRPIAPTFDQQMSRATDLHGALTSYLSPRHLDIVVLSNVPAGQTLFLNSGMVLFEQLGDLTGKPNFFEEDYDRLFDRLNLGLASSTSVP
jgi:Putative papain-like cysteine peptidase (DUF1796)